MDPAEDAVLQTLGELIYENLINMAGFTVVFGAYLVVTAMSMTILWNKPEKGFSVTRYRLLGLMTFILLLTTAMWVGQVSVRAKQIHIALFAGPSVALKDRVKATKNWSSVSVWNNWAGATTMLYADAVLIWRAWVICADKRKWIYISIFFWIVCLAGQLVGNISLIMLHHDNTYSKKFTYGIGVGLAASFLANLAATAIIGSTVYSHRKSIGNVGNNGRRLSSPASKVALVFVESGLFYCMYQFTVFITSLFTDRGNATGATRIAAATMYQTLEYVAALYPTIVIIIVNINRSFLDSTIEDSEFDIPSTEAGSRSINFAQSPLNSGITSKQDEIELSPGTNSRSTLEGLHGHPIELRSEIGSVGKL
ncbi:hypothetical protein DL96DRAFT_1624866 [Flagelloscypha sp. PMI_526]|nr:hypothetical protein DL96DRAFT_1624866 [Flagelloscypha sp. PMI_526]